MCSRSSIRLSETAVTLCDGLFSALYQYDGELIHLVAAAQFHSRSPRGGASRIPAAPQPGLRVRAGDPRPRGCPHPRCRGRAGVSASRADQRDRATKRPLRPNAAGRRCHRRHRRGPRRARTPCSDNQIELLKTFADQAVIAIENTRLFEAEQARTGRAEPRRSSSRRRLRGPGRHLKLAGRARAVFEAMLENAVRICGAKFGNLWLREGDSFRIAATHGAPPAYREYFQREPMVDPDPRSGLGQIVSDEAADPHRGRRGRAQPTRTRCRVATIELARRAAWSACRCSRTTRSSAPSPSTARKCGRSPTSRSICSANFAQPGCHRHREHAPAQRAAQAHCRSDRGAGAADCDSRRAQGHQPLGLRSAGGARYARSKSAARLCEADMANHQRRESGALSSTRRRYGLPRRQQRDHLMNAFRRNRTRIEPVGRACGGQCRAHPGCALPTPSTTATRPETPSAGIARFSACL